MDRHQAVAIRTLSAMYAASIHKKVDTDQRHEVRHEKYNKNKALCGNVDCQVDCTERTRHNQERDNYLHKHQPPLFTEYTP